MNTKKTTNNLLYSAISQVVTICVGLLVPRIVLVSYGSEINGLLNSVSQFIVYLGLFEAGIQLVAVQSLYGPVKTEDKSAINRILSAVNKNYRKTGTIYLAALICLSAIYPMLLRGDEVEYWVTFGVMLFSGLGNVLVFFIHGKYKILLQAEGKQYILTNLHTVITVLNNLAKIVCLLLGCNVVIVVFASFVVNLLQVVYLHNMIKRQYAWIDLSQPPDESSLSQRGAAVLHQLAGMIFQNTDVLILTFFCGLKVVSVYSMYKLVTAHIASILNSIYSSVSFALGQTYNTNKSQYIQMIDIVEVYYSAIVFAIYTVVMVLLIPFIKLYTAGATDINYIDPYLCGLFVAVELLTFARLPMLNTINYAGHFQSTLPQSVVETVINLGVSLFAVKHMGIYGVLVGTVVALLYRDVDVFIYANHKILRRSAKKTVLIYTINLALLVVLVYSINRLPIHITSFVQFLAHGAWMTPCVLLVYLVLQSIIFKEESAALRSKIRSFWKLRIHKTR